MELEFKIKNDHITITNTVTTPVNQSINHLTAAFVFDDDEWDGARVTAVFCGSDNAPYAVELDGLTNICNIPFEALKGNTLRVSAYGVVAENGEIIKRMTSDVITLRLDKSGPVEGAAPGTPEYTTWEQVVAQINDIEAGIVSDGSITADKLGSDVIERIESIGDIDELTTESKDSIVDAINEVNEKAGQIPTDVYTKTETDTLLEAKAAAVDIGNKSALTTNNKGSIVAAVNEVNSVAKGAHDVVTFDSYSYMIAELNSAATNKYKIGQSIYIRTLNVPDVWIYYIEPRNIPYTYATDADFADDLSGLVQVGNYVLSPLETQKVDLSDYYDKTEVDNSLSEKVDTSAITDSVAMGLHNKIPTSAGVATVIDMNMGDVYRTTGQLNDLSTNAKTNLVAAINEAVAQDVHIENVSDASLTYNFTDNNRNYEYRWTIGQDVPNPLLSIGTLSLSQDKPYHTSSIVFTTNNHKLALTYSVSSPTINWIGTDCGLQEYDGELLSVFIPQKNTHYNITFNYDGTIMQAYVIGNKLPDENGVSA